MILPCPPQIRQLHTPRCPDDVNSPPKCVKCGHAVPALEIACTDMIGCFIRFRRRYKLPVRPCEEIKTEPHPSLPRQLLA